MRILRIAVLASLVGLVAGNAWGQLGLYGSPEMLPMSPTGSWGYPASSGYPAARPVSAMQPAPPPPPALPSVPGGLTAPTEVLNTPTPIPLGHPSVGLQPQAGYDVQNSPEYGAAGMNDYGRGYPACGSYGCAADRLRRWYGSASVLMMSRNRANMLWTTYRTVDESDQMDEYGWAWRWGGEIRIGRRFSHYCEPSCGDCGGGGDCGDYGGYREPRGAYAVPRGVGGVGGLSNWALEATYWGLNPFTSYMSLSAPGGVSTPLIFGVGNVEFGGSSAINWFDAADEHRVWRRSKVQSIELSLVHSQFYLPTQVPLTIDWSLGVRYFRFDDRLLFGSLRGGGSWANSAQVAYLDDEIENNLIGLQAGLEAKYNFSPACRIFMAPKFGVYNNHINNDFRLHLANGTVATQTMYPGQTYPVASSEDIVSFVTQLDLGLQWNFTRNWSLRVGYRVVVATAVGLADDQIPTYIADLPEIRNIDHNAELILHGGFAGVAYNF